MAIQVAAFEKKEGGCPMALFSNSNPQYDYYGIGSDVWSFKAGGGFQVMSGTSMACAHVTGFITAMSCGGNRIANAILNAGQREDFLLDIGFRTNGDEKAPKNISLLTFLDEGECDAEWRGQLKTYYLSKALDEVRLLQQQISRLKT